MRLHHYLATRSSSLDTNKRHGFIETSDNDPRTENKSQLYNANAEAKLNTTWIGGETGFGVGYGGVEGAGYKGRGVTGSRSGSITGDSSDSTSDYFLDQPQTSLSTSMLHPAIEAKYPSPRQPRSKSPRQHKRNKRTRQEVSYCFISSSSFLQ